MSIDEPNTIKFLKEIRAHIEQGGFQNAIDVLKDYGKNYAAYALATVEAAKEAGQPVDYSDFEAWAQSENMCLPIEKDYRGIYTDNDTAWALLGWEGALATKRESVAVEDIDVEIAIAEAIQLIPNGTTYEDKGTPVLQYLKKCGFKITKIEDQKS